MLNGLYQPYVVVRAQLRRACLSSPFQLEILLDVVGSRKRISPHSTTPNFITIVFDLLSWTLTKRASIEGQLRPLFRAPFMRHLAAVVDVVFATIQVALVVMEDCEPR
jgi:hypothetical protein